MTATKALIAWSVLEGIFFVSSLIYLPAIAKAIKLSKVQGLPRPWTLWLELIPVLNLYWQFRNVQAANRAFAPDPDHSDDSVVTQPHVYLFSAACARVTALALLVPSVYVFPRFWAHEGPARFNIWAVPVAIFTIVTGYSLWQRARYSRQLGRLAKGLSAEDLGLAVVESHDPARCSCTVQVATDPHHVTEAVLAWAQDLRWHRVKKAECPLTFRLHGRIHNAIEQGHKGITVEVHVPAEGWKVSVRFVAYWDSWGAFQSAYVPQLSRALMAFVRGVCSEFGQRGVTVAPYELGRPSQNRATLRRTAKFRRVSEIVLMTVGLLCLPGAVTVGLWKERLFMFPFAGMWLCAGLLFVVDYFRRRAAGVRGRWSMVGAVIFLLVGAIFVLVGVFPD
jgi:hypothetical protein